MCIPAYSFFCVSIRGVPPQFFKDHQNPGETELRVF